MAANPGWRTEKEVARGSMLQIQCVS